MMKKAIKKLLAALLAVAMLCAMAVPAFAASSSNDGKITINNAVSGQTYTIYRILELEYDQTNNAYRYTAVAAWNAFINTRSSDLKVDNATGTVTWVNSDKNNNSLQMLPASGQVIIPLQTMVSKKLPAALLPLPTCPSAGIWLFPL